MSTELRIGVAKRIVGFTHNFKLYMGSFCGDERKALADKECDTTFCLAGWLAHLDNYPAEYLIHEGTGFNHVRYSYDLIGVDKSDRYWHWLFYDDWDDDLDQAKARAQYIIDHDGAIPSAFEEGDASSYTLEFLIKNKVV